MSPISFIKRQWKKVHEGRATKSSTEPWGQAGSSPLPADGKPYPSKQALPPTTEPQLPVQGPDTLTAGAPDLPIPAAPASQPAVPDGSPHTSSNLPEGHQNLENTEIERDGLKQPSNSEVTAKEGSVPATVVVAESAEQPAHSEDDLQTSIPDQNTSKDGEPRSLWNQAYDKLDKKLVEEYNALLSKELSPASSIISTLSQAQLDDIIQRGKNRMDKPRSKHTIAGHEFEFDVKKQVANAAKFVLWGKALVDEAVKPSPEASLIWAGVGLILPLLTYPYLAAEANESGFCYVSPRMNYYVALESQSMPASISEALKEAFHKDVIDLYQKILEFELKTVLRLFKTSPKRTAQDLIHKDMWDKMLFEVREAERILKSDLNDINDSASSQSLDNLDKSTQKSQVTMKTLLSVAEEHLSVAKEHLDTSSKQLQQATLTNEILREICLPTEPTALYDTVKGSQVCQPETRVTILKQVNDWVNAVDSQNIFWLHGPAGTGKSTIARSVAYGLAEKQQLGASYFFDKRVGRVDWHLFYPTIANRLMTSIPGFASCLRESLEKQGNAKREGEEIDKKAIEEQFERLIMTPLSAIAVNTTEILTRVIVIDALDECKGDDKISNICTQLKRLQGLGAVHLRVFLTSRSTKNIGSKFKAIPHRPLSLLDFPDETKSDISAFLGNRFATIKANNEILENPWPQPKDFVSLLNLATDPSPLFIYAATLCLFVDDGSNTPKAQLKCWLDQADSNTSQLNQIYTPVLNQALFVSQEGKEPRLIDKEAQLDLLHILGAIILLTTPLSVAALGTLLDKDPDTVSFFLQNFRAVLNIPSDPKTPIEIFHKSFSDFLQGQEGTGTVTFRVDAAETHAMLASKCIDRMKKKDHGLREESLREYAKLKDQISETVLHEVVPPDLEYPCLNWVYHLQHCGQDISKEDKIRHRIRNEDICAFLREHFLHWLEVLSLIGRFSKSDGMIRTLQSLTATSESTELSSFLCNARCFLSTGLLLKDLQQLKDTTPGIKLLVEDLHSVDTALRLLFSTDNREWDLLGAGIAKQLEITTSSYTQACEVFKVSLHQWTRHSKDRESSSRSRVRAGFFKKGQIMAMSEQVSLYKLTISSVISRTTL